MKRNLLTSVLVLSLPTALAAACSDSSPAVVGGIPDASVDAVPTATATTTATTPTPPVDAATDASVCPASQTSCQGSCVNTSNDLNNCGACGSKCGAGQVCSSGVCAVTCQADLTTCSPGTSAAFCANTKTDEANCGACGTACPQGSRCNAGKCEASCTAGLTVCGGDAGADAGGDAGAPYCANTAVDPTNCGTCGNTCPTGANLQAFCQANTCKQVCAAGFGNCDANVGNGCETDLKTAAANCGSCGNVCPAGGACIAGSCSAPTATVRAPATALAGCTNPLPHLNHTVAVDSTGVLYAAAYCGADVKVSTSINGGANWSAPVAIGGFVTTGTTVVSLLGGDAGGLVHAFLIDNGGALRYSRSSDAGVTFSAAISLGTGVSKRSISRSQTPDQIAVTVQVGTAPRQYINVGRGAVAWTERAYSHPWFQADGVFRVKTTDTANDMVNLGSNGQTFWFSTLNNGGGSGNSDNLPVVTNPDVIGSAGRSIAAGNGTALHLRFGPGGAENLTVPAALAGTRSFNAISNGKVLVGEEVTAGNSKLHVLTVGSPSAISAGVDVAGALPHAEAIPGTDLALVSVVAAGDVKVAIIKP